MIMLADGEGRDQTAQVDLSLPCPHMPEDTVSHGHYENAPIQIYWKFYHKKKWKFSDKNSDIFHISAQNIDCGYSLEPPRRGGSNEYPQSVFEQK